MRLFLSIQAYFLLLSPESGDIIKMYDVHIKNMEEFMYKKSLILLLTILLTTSFVFAEGQLESDGPNLMGDIHRVVSTEQVLSWDSECDMCVVGFGLAGASATIEAIDNNPDASIIVLEKMPEELQGGQTVASGQSLLIVKPDSLSDFRKYYTRCFSSSPLPEEYFNWFTLQFTTNYDWIKSVIEPAGYEIGYQGGGPLEWGKNVIEFPEFPGSNFKACTCSIREAGYPGFQYGGDWYGFSNAVYDRAEKHDIDIRWETPAIALIQNPLTRRIEGVIAEEADGTLVTIKANKGVLLSCGGYESNVEMNRHFNGEEMVYNTGSEGNVGDGVEMLMAAGAKMWHFDNQTRSCGEVPGIKVDAFPTSFIRVLFPKRWDFIEVSKISERFYDEARRYSRQHWKYYDEGTGNYIDLKHFRSLPVHFIFDDDFCKAQPVVSTWFASPITTYGYKWSKDNSVEIEKGWIVKADTIEELAVKLDRDPAKLKAQIDSYNAACASGVDEQFGRTAEKMEPIDNPPFYAVSETPCLPATTGGAERNIKSQVLDWEGNIIDNLYEAGELGSYVVNLYQNGTFLTEAIASGRAAAQTMFSAQ